MIELLGPGGKLWERRLEGLATVLIRNFGKGEQ